MLLLTTVLLCSGECIKVNTPPKFGRLEVSAFSPIGERLPIIDVDLIDVGTGQSLRRQLKGAVAPKVPYGLYTVRVSGPGFRRSEGRFFVNQPEVSVRMQLSVGVECGGLTSARGSIDYLPKDHEFWVKLVPVRGAGGVETRVGEDGSFLAGEVEDGPYLLFVMDGAAIIHTADVALPSASPIHIKLAK